MSETVTPSPPPPESKRRAGLGAVLAWLALVAVAFVLLAAGMTWISKRTTIASPITETVDFDRLDPGSQPAPDFRLASLDGAMLGPPDYLGDVVLVEFWATWCGPCRKQAEYLEELHEEFDGKGVHFLAVDVGEEPETVRRFAESNPFPYPVLLDPEDTVSPRFGVMGLPTVMIVDRQGSISFKETGVTDARTLRQAILAAAASS